MNHRRELAKLRPGGRNAKRRLVLTGTPIDQNPRELWAVFRFIAPHVAPTGT